MCLCHWHGLRSSSRSMRSIRTMFMPIPKSILPSRRSCEYRLQRLVTLFHFKMTTVIRQHNSSNFSQCDHGRWVCTNRTCPRTCVVLGDMNIWTFDGKQYALATSCKHVLVEVNVAVPDRVKDNRSLSFQ